MVAKKKDPKLAKHGKSGANALKETMGDEAYTKHMAKIAKKRWQKHPEQRSEEYRAKHPVKK